MNLPDHEWHVKHSLKAIDRLKQVGARFCKVYEGKKRPVGNAWPEKENTYIGTDELQDWIKDGGNYGVVGGFGDLTILDEDDERITELRKAKLPETFTVSTCHNDRHSYFVSPNFDGSIRLQDPEDPNTVVGDVQDEGKMVVGPGSIINPKFDKKAGTGGYYKLINNTQPAFLKKQTFKDVFGSFVNVRKKRSKKGTSAGEQEIQTKAEDGEIDITEVGKIREAIKDGDLEYKKGGKHGGYYVGAHPIHGSTTGGNFHVIPELNVWRCWRNGHNSGGGPYYWIAVEEGIIDCRQAYKDSPALQGEKFRKVLDIAVGRGLISGEQARVIGAISPETKEEVGETVESFTI